MHARPDRARLLPGPLLAFTVLILGAPWAMAQDPATEPESGPPPVEQPAVVIDPEVRALIEDLASDSYERRETATDALVARGGSVRPQLLLAREKADLEVRLRIDAILERIAAPVRALGKVPVGTRVPHDIEPRPLGAALAELGRVTGIPLKFEAPRRPGSEPEGEQPEVVLDVGGMLFFEAIDAICERHGLYLSRNHLNGGVILRPGIVPAGITVHEGPLRLAVSSMQVSRRTDFVNSSTVSASLSIMIDAEPGAGMLGVLMPRELPEPRDEDGHAIGWEIPTTQGPRDVRLFSTQQRSWLQLQMHAPRPEAKELHDLVLPLEFVVAREVVEGTLEAGDVVKDGPKRGGIQLRVVDHQVFAGNQRLTLGFVVPDVEGAAATRMPVQWEDIHVTDTEGRPMQPIGGRGRSTAGTERRLSLTLPKGDIGRIRVTTLRSWQIHEKTFRFEVLRLP